jgi:plasmid stabilization system protein ParE
VRVDVSTQAQQDLADIAEYIARDDPIAAEQWVSRLEAAALAVGDNPRVGRSRIQ